MAWPLQSLVSQPEDKDIIMQMPPNDPRFPRNNPFAHGPNAGYGAQQPTAPTGQDVMQTQPGFGFGMQQGAYGAPAQQAPHAGYGGPQPMHGYAQPQAGYAQPNAQPNAQSAPPQAGMPGAGSVGFSLGGFAPSMPSLGGLGQVPGMAGLAAKQPSGLSPAVAFGLALGAVVIALIFDVIFLRVHIPGIGGYAWYLTTALSFAGAGYGGAKWTRASQGTAMAAVVIAGLLYGVADLGLGLVLEGLEMQSAMFLGIQGVVIAAVCGGGGVRRGLSARDA